MSAHAAIAVGWRRTGATCSPRRAGGSWPWPARRRSSPTPRRKPGRRRGPPTRRTTASSCSTSARRQGRAFMRIVGEWLPFDDGFTRPVVWAKVLRADGELHVDRFLVDSGADRTVFCATFWQLLHRQPDPPKSDMTLM